MQSQKQVHEAPAVWDPDDALEEFRISAETMRQAITNGFAVALSAVIEAAYYEDEWWVENRTTKEWVMADTRLAATLDQRRDQMREADASVAARAEKKRR
jgi:hypothetical protein